MQLLHPMHRSPSKSTMPSLSGMSESERQHVQARVRAAMDAQVLNEGRYQGGRAPYGYSVVDGGPYPNPRKSAEGFRLRVLAADEDAAPVVRRIFNEYLDGAGDRAIATGLNRDGIACPSASRPEQNRHRLADGWQSSTVRAILENPRCTGYAVFGRWTRNEVLADPDDVGAGHVVRFRRSGADRVVRSRVRPHPEIVAVEEFTRAQLVRRSRGSGGRRGIASLERDRAPVKRTYLFRGLVRCEVCGRKMQAGMGGRNQGTVLLPVLGAPAGARLAGVGRAPADGESAGEGAHRCGQRVDRPAVLPGEPGRDGVCVGRVPGGRGPVSSGGGGVAPVGRCRGGAAPLSGRDRGRGRPGGDGGGDQPGPSRPRGGECRVGARSTGEYGG